MREAGALALVFLLDLSLVPRAAPSSLAITKFATLDGRFLLDLLDGFSFAAGAVQLAELRDGFSGGFSSVSARWRDGAAGSSELKNMDSLAAPGA